VLSFVAIISCTGDYTEAVKVYRQIGTMSTPFGWCGLGLAFNLNNNGQEGLQGVLFITRRGANNLYAHLDSIYSSCSVV